jgi:hypothetical protein
MTISRALGFVIVAGTGVVGAFIGRALSIDAPRIQEDASVSPAHSRATPADGECEPERTALASIKTQLATCIAFEARDPESAPSSVPERREPDPPAFIQDEIKSYHERLESLSEAVIVRHGDGTVGVYKPDEWPIDGNGLIIGRKLPSGQIGWYSGPDAGPRSDPAAFRRLRRGPAE